MSDTVFYPRMPEVVLPEAALEVISPDGTRQIMRVECTPFLIGRGADVGNHVQLSDRRISRQCAALIFDGRAFRLEDRGQKRGLFINGQKAPETVTLRVGRILFRTLPSRRCLETRRIRVVPGDSVAVEISPYDLTRGRITRRL